MAKGRSLLSGKVGIVAGGGRGIGAATAVALAEAGAAVTVTARTTTEIETVAKRIRQAGGEAEAVSMDVTDAEQVRGTIEYTIAAFGQVDMLINCAAVVGPVGQRVWEVDPDAWRRAIEIDLLGTYLLCHGVVPYMLGQGSGRILNLSSSLGAEVPVDRFSAYCAAKAGVNHFTRVLAAELRGTGVTANVVYPGLVKTDLLQEFRSGMGIGNRARPLGPQGGMRARDPSEPATLLLWLCSPETALVNGRIISIDDPGVQWRLAAFQRRQMASHGMLRNQRG